MIKCLSIASLNSLFCMLFILTSRHFNAFDSTFVLSCPQLYLGCIQLHFIVISCIERENKTAQYGRQYQPVHQTEISQQFLDGLP